MLVYVNFKYHICFRILSNALLVFLKGIHVLRRDQIKKQQNTRPPPSPPPHILKANLNLRSMCPDNVLYLNQEHKCNVTPTVTTDSLCLLT